MAPVEIEAQSQCHWLTRRRLVGWRHPVTLVMHLARPWSALLLYVRPSVLCAAASAS